MPVGYTAIDLATTLNSCKDFENRKPAISPNVLEPFMKILKNIDEGTAAGSDANPASLSIIGLTCNVLLLALNVFTQYYLVNLSKRINRRSNV